MHIYAYIHILCFNNCLKAMYVIITYSVPYPLIDKGKITPFKFTSKVLN